MHSLYDLNVLIALFDPQHTTQQGKKRGTSALDKPGRRKSAQSRKTVYFASRRSRATPMRQPQLNCSRYFTKLGRTIRTNSG